MRILLTGATGFIGTHLRHALVQAGHEVIACARSDPSHTRNCTLPCDFTRDHRPEDWLPRLAGIDAVINSVGIIREHGSQTFQALHTEAPRALFTACERAGVSKVIQISALGADQDAASRYHLTKRAADDDLAARRLDWLILRPSIVYGPGAHSSAFFRALAALALTPLVDGGDQQIQPIHIDDLVRAVLLALAPGGPSKRRIDCVGQRPVAFRDMLAAWRRWLGLGRMRTVSVPYRWALAAARFGALLGDAPFDRESVQMLQRGNRGDVEPFERAFGFRPRALEQAMESMPATEADRWHARLFFLRPLVRWSLGLMWVWTGIASAFLYPVEESYRMLGAVGITGSFAAPALYGAALLDALLGVALLAGCRVRLVGGAQIALIVVYTGIITWALPGLWLHPFGPVTKNLPLLAATLVMISLEDRAK